MTLKQRLTVYWWMLAGFVILITPCVEQEWEPATSTAGPYPPHPIDQWIDPWLQSIYGNPEDGVSGQYALIWNDAATERVPYKPGASPAWRAYCWSAWRNSTNMLTREYGKT